MLISSVRSDDQENLKFGSQPNGVNAELYECWFWSRTFLNILFELRMYTKLKYRATRWPVFLTKCLGIAICLLASRSAAWPQNYLAPRPISFEKEAWQLALLKKSGNGSNRLAIFLDLANININKPLRGKGDLELAFKYATAASNLGTKLNDQRGHDIAQLYIADILMLKNQMKAAELIGSLINDTSKVKLWLNLSVKYFERNSPNRNDDWNKSLFFARQARTKSERLHLPIYELLADKDIALVQAYQKLPGSETNLIKTVNRIRVSRISGLTYAYAQVAAYYQTAGNMEQALRYSDMAVGLISSAGDSLSAADIYYVAAAVNIEKGNFQKGFDLAKMAIYHFKHYSGRYSLNDRFVTRMPVTALKKMGKYKEALQYAKNVEKNYPAENIDDQVDDAIEIGNIYREMKLYNKSESVFLHALKLNKTQVVMNAMLYKDIGQMYIDSKQYLKARPYLYLLWKHKESSMSPAIMAHMDYMLFQVDSAYGDYKAAVGHLSRFRGIEEVNLKQLKAREVKRLETRYETKKKENTLKVKEENIILLKQMNKLQQIKLDQSQLEKDITIAAICLLSAITVLLFWLYRSKQRKFKEIKQKGEEIIHKNEVITEKNALINRKSKQLDLLLEEKEWLLKEVHHRVKNNLHTVICLLESQAAYLEKDALKALEKSQNRIYAMSLIHQKLYQSTDLQTVDMAGYIPELVQYLKDSFDVSDQIVFRYHLDKISLDASLAIPVALIINEALTNSIRYAFPGKHRGEILISLYEMEETVVLELADNGVGMQDDPGRIGPPSRGLELIKGLVQEIYGDIRFSSRNGFLISVLFKKNALSFIDRMTLDKAIT